jgi:hypothetical protein
MAIKTYVKTSSANLSANFKVKEFACKGGNCCKEVKIDTKLVDYLQKIRNHFGKAVTINSAYRCATHNKKVGGSSNSNHTKGQAADIVVSGVKPLEVAKYAESLGIKGIGLYDTFVHIDTRTNKFFWYSDKQEPRYTFGGINKVREWQQAAIADGFKFASGADGIWGNECIEVAKKAICKKQLVGYKNKNLTKIVQKAVGVTADGKFGNATKQAVIGWQKLMGLSADGVVGYNTWRKILGV